MWIRIYYFSNLLAVEVHGDMLKLSSGHAITIMRTGFFYALHLPEFQSIWKTKGQRFPCLCVSMWSIWVFVLLTHGSRQYSFWTSSCLFSLNCSLKQLGPDPKGYWSSHSRIIHHICPSPDRENNIQIYLFITFAIKLYLIKWQMQTLSSLWCWLRKLICQKYLIIWS